VAIFKKKLVKYDISLKSKVLDYSKFVLKITISFGLTLLNVKPIKKKINKRKNITSKRSGVTQARIVKERS